MGGQPDTRLNGAQYIISCVHLVEKSAWYQKARTYVQSVIHDLDNLESFQKLARDLATDTNPGRLIVMYLYAEELKKIIPEQTSDIDRILFDCLQTGFMEIVQRT